MTGLRLDVTLLGDPPLWRWAILDERRDVIVYSSWDQEWTAYRSRDDARRAGEERLGRMRELGAFTATG